MKVRQIFGTWALALAAIAGAWSPAEAAPIISLVPATQNVNIGDTVVVDVGVSGLTDPVGGFSLILDFSSSLLEGLGYTIAPELGSGLDLSFGFTGGSGSPLDLFVVSLEDEATLSALQGAAFTLASISFTATANGLSPLRLSGVVLSDADGFEMPSQSTGGSVCVGGDCSVPEPGLLALLSAGLAGAGLRRFKARRV